MANNEYKTLIDNDNASNNTIAADREAQWKEALAVHGSHPASNPGLTAASLGKARIAKAIADAEVVDGYDFVITCPTWKLTDIDAGLTSLKRRASRMKLGAPEAKVIERFGAFGIKVVEGREETRFRALATVAVKGPEVKLPGGWELVAVIDHKTAEGAGNLVKRVPGFENLRFPKAWRTAANTCDHCKTARRRNETFVLRNKRGQKVRVGRQCIRDFLGHGSPESVVGSLALVRDFVMLRDEDHLGWFGGGELRIGILDFLTFCAALVLTSGWVSRKEARESWEKDATADIAWNALNSKNPKVRRWSEDLLAEHGEKAKATAEAALEFARKIKGDSEYCHNLRTCTAIDHVTAKTIGLVASAIPVHARHLERTVARRKLPEVKADQWIGEAGDKFGRKLTAADKRKGATAHPVITGYVLTLRYIESDWGCSTLVKVLTLDGQLATWFSSADVDVDRGDLVNVVATVKRQSEYRGQKETQLTRCRIRKAA